MQEPRSRSRHLYAGHHLANQQAPAWLIPGSKASPVSMSSSLSTRHQWFAFARLPDPHLPRSTARLFPRRSPPRLLTAAARGGLRPPPAQRPRRASKPAGPAPPSPAQHRIQRLDLLHPASFIVRGTPLDDVRYCGRAADGRLLLAAEGGADSPRLGRPGRRPFRASAGSASRARFSRRLSHKPLVIRRDPRRGESFASDVRRRP